MGLFGKDYGFEDEFGVSPTEREFDRATESDRHRLIFVKGAEDGRRHPKIEALIGRAQPGLAKRRFATPAELVAGLYAALVQYLEAKELFRFGPFDAALCSGATLDDLDVEEMYRFIRIARNARQLPLPEETPPANLLRHLNLLNRGRLTNAAVLLFGRAPQRFLISSEVKCAHFHGTEVAKPIPSYQVYKGTVFELVDQAVDFVMSKIALAVGTRAKTVQAPVVYEVPKGVVTEAIVNAVAHRDYTDSSSVQVMLFADRLEIMNSGRLPPPLTVMSLRVAHQSLPGNPLIAGSMYLLSYIEKMGTGTVDMFRRCAEAGLQEPEFDVSGGFLTRIWRPGGHARPSRSVRGTLRGIRDSTRATTQETGYPVSAATQEISRTIQETPGTTQETGDSARDTTQETHAKADSSPTRERIVALLRSNPTLTRVALASHIGVTPEGVKYHLAKLRAAGRIRHVGPTKKGRWEVLDASPPSANTQSGSGSVHLPSPGSSQPSRPPHPAPRPPMPLPDGYPRTKGNA